MIPLAFASDEIEKDAVFATRSDAGTRRRTTSPKHLIGILCRPKHPTAAHNKRMPDIFRIGHQNSVANTQLAQSVEYRLTTLPPAMPCHYRTTALAGPRPKGIPPHSLGLLWHPHTTVGEHPYWLKGGIHGNPRDSQLQGHA